MSTNFLPACLDEPAAVTCFFAGRLRLRHPALRAPDRAEAARARLAATPGVHAVTVNPRTGSLLLEYDAAKPDAELLVRDLIGAAAPKPDRRRNGGTRRTRSRLLNRAMLAALAGTTGLALADRTRAHTLAGGLFLILNALHEYEYRRNLLR